MPTLLLLIILSFSIISCQSRLLHVRAIQGLQLDQVSKFEDDNKRVEGPMHVSIPLQPKTSEDAKNGHVTEGCGEDLKKVNGKRGEEEGEEYSFASVTWQVPHDEDKEQPRFHLDYDEPRTHPPSNN